MAFTFEKIKSKMRVSVNSDGRLVKTYHEEYLAKDTGTKSKDQVAAAIGILPGAPHPEWSMATCRDIDIDVRMTRVPHLAWTAAYQYSTEAVAPSTAAVSDTDPTVRNIKRHAGYSEQQTFIVKNRDGSVIQDGAGSPYDGGVPVNRYLFTAVWDRDEVHSATSMSQAAAYTGYLNSDTFMGCAPGTLLLVVTGEENYEGSYHFWKFNYQMTYDPLGWQPRPINAGLWEIKWLSGKRSRILEDDGKATQEPQPLYADGRVIPVANRPAFVNYITVTHYPTLEFSTLSLPTT